MKLYRFRSEVPFFPKIIKVYVAENVEANPHVEATAYKCGVKIKCFYVLVLCCILPCYFHTSHIAKYKHFCLQMQMCVFLFSLLLPTIGRPLYISLIMLSVSTRGHYSHSECLGWWASHPPNFTRCQIIHMQNREAVLQTYLDNLLMLQFDEFVSCVFSHWLLVI